MSLIFFNPGRSRRKRDAYIPELRIESLADPLDQAFVPRLTDQGPHLRLLPAVDADTAYESNRSAGVTKVVRRPAHVLLCQSCGQHPARFTVTFTDPHAATAEICESCIPGPVPVGDAS